MQDMQSIFRFVCNVGSSSATCHGPHFLPFSIQAMKVWLHAVVLWTIPSENIACVIRLMVINVFVVAIR